MFNLFTGRDESSSTRFRHDGGERNGLWPPQGPDDHGEDITVALAGDQPDPDECEKIFFRVQEY